MIFNRQPSKDLITKLGLVRKNQLLGYRAVFENKKTSSFQNQDLPLARMISKTKMNEDFCSPIKQQNKYSLRSY